jgi:hypothetical protein
VRSRLQEFMDHLFDGENGKDVVSENNNNVLGMDNRYWLYKNTPEKS